MGRAPARGRRRVRSHRVIVGLLAGDGVEQQIVEEEDAAPLPPLQPRLDQVALAHEAPREADEVGVTWRREALGEVLELLLLFHRALLLVDVLRDVLHALERLAERLLVRVALVGHREQLLEEQSGVRGADALHRLDRHAAARRGRSPRGASCTPR